MLTAEITYPSSSPDTGLSESTGDSSDLEVGWTEKVTLFHSKKKHYYETSTVMLHIIGRSHGDRHQSRIFVWYASFFIAAYDFSYTAAAAIVFIVIMFSSVVQPSFRLTQPIVFPNHSYYQAD